MRTPRNGIPPAVVSGARWVELSKGDWALVDEGDYGRVMQRLWSTLSRPGRSSYALRRENGRTIYLHRFVMDAPPGMDVDHVNGDTLDCRRSNLRVCTHAENQRNYRKTKSPTSSRFKGVGRHHSGGWYARIKINRKSIHIGVFGSEEEAARSYDAAAARRFGEFACLNFPQGGSP